MMVLWWYDDGIMMVLSWYLLSWYCDGIIMVLWWYYDGLFDGIMIVYLIMKTI